MTPSLLVMLLLCPAEPPQRTEPQVRADALLLGGDPRAEVAQTQHEALVVRAKEMRARGIQLGDRYPGILSSEKVPGLKPGFVVVVAGFCPAGEGAKVLKRLRKIVPGAYLRKVTLPRAALSCPTLSGDGSLSDAQWVSAHLGPGSHPAADVARLVRASNWIGETGELQWGPDAACWALYGTSCAESATHKASTCGPGTTAVTPIGKEAALCRDEGKLGGTRGTWLVLRLDRGPMPAWFVPDDARQQHQLTVGKSLRDVTCFEDTTTDQHHQEIEHRLTCLSREDFKMLDLVLNRVPLKKAPAAFPSTDYNLKSAKGRTLLCTADNRFVLTPKDAWEYAPDARCE